MSLLLVAVLFLGNSPIMYTDGPDGSSLVLNEFMCHPLASSTHIEGEYIELYNDSEHYINICGYTIENDQGQTITLNTYLVPPEGFYVLGASGDTNRNGGYVPDFVYSDFTIYENDELILVSAGGVIIDQIRFNPSTWPIEEGRSCERINPGWVSNSPSTWGCASETYGSGDFGTPGEQNSVFQNSFAQNSWAFIKAFVQ